MTVDYLTEFKRLSALLEAALKNLRDQTLKLAQAENDYRKARAKAWLEAEGLAKQREDSVNAITADKRLDRDLADGLRRLELETVRARQQQISALQSLLNAEKAEFEIGAYGPDEAA